MTREEKSRALYWWKYGYMGLDHKALFWHMSKHVYVMTLCASLSHHLLSWGNSVDDTHSTHTCVHIQTHVYMKYHLEITCATRLLRLCWRRKRHEPVHVHLKNKIVFWLNSNFNAVILINDNRKSLLQNPHLSWRSLRVIPQHWSTYCLYQIACWGCQTILVLLHSRWQVGFVAFANISHSIF